MSNLKRISPVRPNWASYRYSPEGWASAAQAGYFVWEKGHWKTAKPVSRFDFWEPRRQEALKRANGHCESCGVIEQNLEVHHRTPIIFAMDRYLDLPINTLSELQVLCVLCHGKTRRTVAI